MIRTEICLETATRMFAGVAVAAIGNSAGSITAELLPQIGLVLYLLGFVPALVVGLYLVSTGLWVLVEGAVEEATPDVPAPTTSSASTDDVADDE